MLHKVKPLARILPTALATVVLVGVFALSNHSRPMSSGVVSDATSIVAAVGALVELPHGEAPTVATITDREKLSRMLFFANGEAGDVLLVYNNARLAILYRPSTHKIINVGPLVAPGTIFGGSGAVATSTLRR